ncbi:hypothetical protein [Luteimonas sp. MC1828]|uniref:hypothetical protein n=1 Tax=Luteimonas sp. MC1828 TaxID=2799787 RepID=UPI0018F1C73A|nr:hypothetical protein [Luteimonas sp. MC1828]MBJ7575476.1 hypothetical protein [Luteimonas sp. MC1828]
MRLWTRRTLGVLAIGGGALGLAVGVQAAASANGMLSWLVIVPFLCLYLWGIWCGVCLVENREGAARANMFFWAIQMPLVQSPYIGYLFASGFFSTITFQPFGAELGFLFWLGSKFEVSLMQADKPVVLGVNLFALFVVALLYRSVRRAPPNNSFKPTPLRGAA